MTVDPAIKAKWAIRTPEELNTECMTVAEQLLVNNLIPERSTGIVVGDSGLGKSPLLYQMALCISAGVPFLGHNVSQGRVLYLDYENGLAEVNGILGGLTRHLGLSAAPSDLLLWNVNDCAPTWGQVGHGLRDLIGDVHPRLVIVDPVTACYPDIENKNSDAVKLLQMFRRLSRDQHTAIFAVHHLRKQSGQDYESLEESDAHRWFLQARGPRALINASDVRLGVDRPGFSGLADAGKEVALVLRGFRRVHGEIPLTYLARVRDSAGEPLGYDRLTGPSLLFNPEQEQAFARFPPSFRFKDAQQAYGKGAQATTDFLSKCINLRILRRAANGYEKGAE